MIYIDAHQKKEDIVEAMKDYHNVQQLWGINKRAKFQCVEDFRAEWNKLSNEGKLQILTNQIFI